MKSHRKKFVFAFLCLWLNAKGTFSRNSFLWHEVQEWRDKVALNYYLWKMDAASRVVCSFHCLLDKTCESFFYHYDSSTKLCEGHPSVYLYLSDASNQVSPHTQYYKIACEGGPSYRYDRAINTCYSVKEIRRSWYAAQLHCQSEKAWLLDLSDHQVASHLMNNFNNYHDPFLIYYWFWLGLTDLQSEGNYVWSHSSKALNGSGNWLPGEPDNANTNQHCVYMRHQDGRFQWGDIECTTDFIEFICQSIVV
nr:secretory phospholipase A2 receptor-like isoform X2 [Crassostrea gigas]